MTDHRDPLAESAIAALQEQGFQIVDSRSYAALSNRLGELEAGLLWIALMAEMYSPDPQSQLNLIAEAARKTLASRLLSSPEGEENSPAQVQNNGPEIATGSDRGGELGTTRAATICCEGCDQQVPDPNGDGIAFCADCQALLDAGEQP